jgi:hypothetical protein
VWAQAPPDIDVDIINRLPGPSWWTTWLPVLSAIVVFVGGSIVQFIVQRREFDNGRDSGSINGTPTGKPGPTNGTPTGRHGLKLETRSALGNC